MKLINVEQNSPEWHEIRKKHIGASDVSCILGKGFRSLYDLYLEKTDDENQKKQFETKKMREGTENEPIAREKYIRDSGIQFSKDTGESENLPFLMASFDGRSPDGKILLEIKSFEPKKYQEALNSEIEEKYYIQMQMQMYVTDGVAEKCIYLVSNTKTGEYFTKEVFPDEKKQASYIKACFDFWQRVLEKNSPEAPYKNVDDKELTDLALKYKKMSQEKEKIEKEMEEIKEQLKTFANGDSVYFAKAGIKGLTIPSIGTVDWVKLCDAYGISKDEQDKFRKKSSSYFKLIADKKKVA